MAESSTRRASAILTKGMITDTTNYSEGGLLRLHDAYIARSGEIRGRGGRLGSRTAVPATSTANGTAASYSAGCGVAGFHADLGIAANFGIVASGAAGITSVDATNVSTFEFQVNPLQTLGSAVGTNWGTTAASSEWTTLGTACALNVGGTLSNYSMCDICVAADNEIVFGEKTGPFRKWGGSNLADVSAASASGIYWSSGTNVISGSGTTWTSQLEAGMYLQASGYHNTTGNNAPCWRITRVVSNTELQIDRTLWSNVDSTARLPWRAVSIGTIGGGRTSAGSASWSTENPVPVSRHGVCAVHQGRLFVAAPADYSSSSTFNFSRIRWSGNQAESDGGRDASGGLDGSAKLTTGGATADGSWAGMDHWHPNGFIDVLPGVGGYTRGLVSLGSDLIILRTNAVIKLTGAVQFNNAGDAAVEIVARGAGPKNNKAWCVTPIGIAFADDDGLFIYDGNSVKNLCVGRVMDWWQYSQLSSQGRIHVHYANGRITVGGLQIADAREGLVYHIDQDYFSTMSGGLGWRSVIQVFDIDDNNEGAWAFMEYPYAGNASGHYFVNLDHEYGTVGPYAAHGVGDSYVPGSNSTAAPAPDVIIPFNIGEAPFSEGRVDNTYASYILTQYGGSSPVVSATLIPGAFGINEANLYNTNEWTSTEQTTENTGALSTYDRSFRLSLGGTVFNAYQRLRLKVSGRYGQFALNAAGIDYTLRNVIQSNYSSAD